MFVDEDKDGDGDDDDPRIYCFDCIDEDNDFIYCYITTTYII
jgi:hypothetical protein